MHPEGTHGHYPMFHNMGPANTLLPLQLAGHPAAVAHLGHHELEKGQKTTLSKQ
jgi:hypothetical protein